MQALQGSRWSGNAIEIEHRAQGLGPRLAAPDIEVPVQIKVLIAANARDRLLLAALQRQVSNPASVQDRQGSGIRIGIDVACRADRRLVSGKATEIACSIADVGDGKVTDCRESQIWHFSICTPQLLERALSLIRMVGTTIGEPPRSEVRAGRAGIGAELPQLCASVSAHLRRLSRRQKGW